MLFGILLIALSSLRGNSTGRADYGVYLRIYESISDWSSVVNPSTHVEIGYRLFSYMGNELGFGGQFIIVLMALISSIPVISIINKYSPNKNLSLVVWFPYILTMNMHSSRTAVAAAFGMLLLIAYYNRSRVKVALYFVLAVSFHTISLIYLFIFAVRLKLSILYFSYLILFLLTPLFTVSKIAPVFLSALGQELLALKFTRYIASEDYGHPMPLYDPRVAGVFFIATTIYVLRNYIQCKFELFIFKVFLIGSIIMVMFIDVTIMAWRLSYLFLLIGVLVIPILVKYVIKFFKGNQKVIYIFIPAIYLIVGAIISVNAQPFIFYR